MFKFDKKDLLNLTTLSCKNMYTNSIKALGTLGSPTPEYWIFVTISLPPNMIMGTLLNGIIEGKKFIDLPQRHQLEVCIRYFENVYMPEFRKPIVILTYEYDKSGKVHLHAIIIDELCKNNYDLADIQSNIRLHPVSQKIMKRLRLSRDYFNSIVKCDDVKKTVEYLDKDYTSKKMSSYFKGFSNYIDVTKSTTCICHPGRVPNVEDSQPT